MKTEELVPPLELCKKIPNGEFEDSCLVYCGKMIVLRRSTVKIVTDEKFCPAPTLEEILQKLINLSTYRINVCESWGEWHIDCYDNERLLEKDSEKNIVTAALKLWLERVQAQGLLF